MHIHTVQPHDTIFKIARRYSVQPTKILEDNGLRTDRLACGEELLILTPTRTVTVRGGESLSTIGKRFGVKKSALIANNPALCGSDILRPGHILSVKFDTPPMGVASAVGICTSKATKNKLDISLPYLTYLIVKAYSITASGIKERFDSSRIADRLKTESKISLLSFSDKSSGAFLKNKNPESVCELMVNLAKRGGFSGISLEFSPGESDVDNYERFLLNLKKHLYGNDLILFCEGQKCPGSDCFEIADGVVLHPSRSIIIDESDIDGQESSKAFIYINTSAHFDERCGSVSEAKRIARSRGIKIKICGEPPYCYYDYLKYTNGHGVSCSVKFPSLFGLSSAFAKGAEAGFLGFAFDVSRITVPCLSLFNACFARADYSLVT